MKSEYSEWDLDTAVRYGEIKIVEYLLSQGAKVDAVDPPDDWTPLLTAIHKENPDVAHILLEHGANLNRKKQDGETPLMMAARQGCFEMVRLLLINGADIAATNNEGWNALFFAISYSSAHDGENYIPIVRLLLEAGVDVNYASPGGMTALKMAVPCGPDDPDNIELMWILLKAGANVDAADGDEGDTALLQAVYNEHFSTVRWLLEVGADVNKLNREGESAWNYARMCGNTEIVELLEKAAAREPNEADFDLHQAVLWGKTELVQRLLEQGADANQRNRQGTSLLTIAIDGWGKLEIVRLLLDYGADVNVRGKYGITPLMSASQVPDYEEIVHLLIEYGADINAVADGEGTALLDAARNGNVEVVRFLLDKGVDINKGDRENLYSCPSCLAV